MYKTPAPEVFFALLATPDKQDTHFIAMKTPAAAGHSCLWGGIDYRT